MYYLKERTTMLPDIILNLIMLTFSVFFFLAFPHLQERIVGLD